MGSVIELLCVHSCTSLNLHQLSVVYRSKFLLRWIFNSPWCHTHTSCRFAFCLRKNSIQFVPHDIVQPRKYCPSTCLSRTVCQIVSAISINLSDTLKESCTFRIFFQNCDRPPSLPWWRMLVLFTSCFLMTTSFLSIESSLHQLRDSWSDIIEDVFRNVVSNCHVIIGFF